MNRLVASFLLCALSFLPNVAVAVAPISFAPKTDFPTGPGSGPGSIAVGDLNRDGILDLVTGDQLGATVSVLLGNGTGGFGPNPDFAAPAAPVSGAIGDLNGDGHA